MQADEKRAVVSTSSYMRNGTREVSVEDARDSRENEVHKSYRAHHHGKEWSCAVDVVQHRESIAEFLRLDEAVPSGCTYTALGCSIPS